MRSGGFMVQELECQDCATVLGWKVIKAFERSEKWKENGFLLELDLLEEVDVDLDDVFQQYYRSSIMIQKKDARSVTPDSEQGPKTPIPRFSSLEADVMYRKSESLGSEPASAAVSFFEVSNSDSEEEITTPTTSDIDEASVKADVPASLPVHRRVASLEPSVTEPKTILPRRPSEPLVYTYPAKPMVSSSSPSRKPTGILRSAKPPRMHDVPLAPVVVTLPNPHDSLASEIDRMARDLQPILEALPQTAAMRPEGSVRPPSKDLSTIPVPVAPKEPVVAAPTASTLRLRRQSFRSTANRPSFAEQSTTAPPLPVGAAIHVRKLSNNSPTHSPKGSVSSSPSATSSSLPSSSSPASSQTTLLAPAPGVSDATSPRGIKRAPSPGVRFEAKTVVITDDEESARKERARVAELTRVLALDGSIPPLTPRLSPSMTAPSFPLMEPVPLPPVPPSLNVPGKTLPFPRAPTPDASLLANRTVRKRALSQPDRRPSVADLQAARSQADGAMPAPVPRPAAAAQTSAPTSRTPSIVDAAGQPVITTRLPAMTKRPSLKNLGAAAASSASLPIPRKGALAAPDSGRSSRATSLIDGDERPRVVTTRLPAMATRRALQGGDAARPSSRALSFFETDPKVSNNVATRLPSMRRRPSVPDLLNTRENPPPTASRSTFSLFKKKVQV
jgi:hypothetical protein